MMRPLTTVAGLLIVIIGGVAAITGEFNSAGSWLLALSLAALGLAGVITVATAAISR